MVKKEWTLSYHYMVSTLTSAKQKFVINKLLEKGGVLNKVATKYIESGFKVKVSPKFENIDIVAHRGDIKYGLKVFYEKKIINKNDLENFIKKCSELGYKPIVVLYGNGPRLSQELLGETRDFIVKRIRV